MYHGTSSKFLPKIFQLGMIPNPTKGRWKGDEELEGSSIHSPSMHSLEGSYWTNNITTARSSARDALSTGGEARLALIIAQIVPQTAKSDEDDVRIPVRRAFKNALSKHFGARDLDQSVPMAKGRMDADPAFFQELVSDFSKTLHDELKSSDKMPIDNNMMQDAFEAAFERILGHVDMSEGSAKRAYIESYEYALGKKIDDWEEARKLAREKYEKNDVPDYSKTEGERKFLQALDKISGRYRKFAQNQGGFNQSLRVTTPVGFSGRNKIVAIVLGDGANMELVYGKLPQKFIKDHSSSWGPKFKITDKKSGQVIHDTTQE